MIVVYEVVVEELPEVVEPVLSCDLLSIAAVPNKERTFTFTTQATAKDGASIDGYVYDFGDGSDDMLTDKNEVTHSYDKAGEYVTRVTVKFDVNDETVSKTSAKCMVEVTIKKEVKSCPLPGKGHLPEDHPDCKEVPSELPKTGPADVVGMFAAVSVAAGAAHRFVWAGRKQY